MFHHSKNSKKQESFNIMEKTDFIPFSRPSLCEEEEQAVLKVMRSGWITTANEALLFEKEFSQKINARHCLAVNSNTSGLQLAMEACGIKKGTKILTTPYTFISTATSAIHLGGDVVYADIEKDNYSIDPEQIENKLKHDKSIKAIIPVHIAGNPCNMKAITEIAKKYKVYVIEDCAHALPSLTEDGYCGTLGDAGVFSFYATKTMTTAEGGMISTNNYELAKRMTVMRMHGIDRTVWDRYTSDKASWEYDVIDAGYKFNLPDILAAIGRVQLKKVDYFYEKRLSIVKRYNDAFKDCGFIELPPSQKGNAYHLYMIRINPDICGISRNKFSAELQKKGIGVSVHFIPHFYFTYWKRRGLDEKDFPNAKRLFEKTLSLPLWPDMTDSMVNRVIDAVIETGKGK